jgi:ABC-type transporter Mla MlaB component
MLEIVRSMSTDETATYALSGEITADQLERIEALIHDAAERNVGITFDLRHVWRIERNAAFLISRHACGSNHQVHFVGVPRGLREWLGAVAEDVPSTNPRRWREGGVVMEILSHNWGWCSECSPCSNRGSRWRPSCCCSARTP